MPGKNTVEEPRDQGQGVQSPSTPQSTHSSMPLFLASLALLLAAFSLTATLISSKNMGAHQPLDNIRGKLSTIEKRVDQMETSIAANRRDLVQAELKKMLLALRELSQLGDNETVSEIAKAEAILQQLSSRKTKVRAKVDLKSTEQEPEKADVPSEATEESATQNSPAIQTSEKSSQDKTETQTVPATSEEETTLQNEAAPTVASEATSETESSVVDEKTGSGKPAETAKQLVHEEPEASQTKEPAN